MCAKEIDANPRQRLDRVGEMALAGELIGRGDATWMFGLEAQPDIAHLMSWANRVRDRYRGNRIHLCSIVNVKSGGCSENCSFCAQSAAYDTGAPRYGFIEPEPVLKAAAEAQANGVNALGIVAAWKGLSEGPVLDEVCARLRDLTRDGKARPDASLGIIKSQAVADRLREAGLECYNHNLETSKRFFPNICGTHTYEDRVETLKYLRHAGIKLCSGGILGMGETREDRCDFAFALRGLQPDFVPLNFLNPIPGTPLEKRPLLPPLEILKIIACFRLILPQQEIFVAGGRVVNLRDVQPLMFFAGASGLMVGNYLTTLNQSVEKDLQMIKDLGFEIRRDERFSKAPPAEAGANP
jgi:biotin synthase